MRFYTLADAPETIRIVCECGRAGRYSRTRAMATHGAETMLPDFLALVSADCPRRRHAMNGAGCSARYAGETIDGIRR
jgi:hypothetical protein